MLRNGPDAEVCFHIGAAILEVHRYEAAARLRQGIVATDFYAASPPDYFQPFLELSPGAGAVAMPQEFQYDIAMGRPDSSFSY